MDTPPPPRLPSPLGSHPRDAALVEVWAQAALANPYGVALLDAVGNTIVAVNEAGARMMRLDASAIVGHNVLEFYVPADRERVIGWFRSTHAGIHAQFEAEFIRGDGTTVPAEVTVHAVRDADGRVTHHVAAARDITARREAQRASLEYQQRLRALTQELERAREADRHAIGEALHEDLMQSLTALALGLERLKHGLAQRDVQDAALLQVIDRLQAGIRDTTASTRATVAHLRPAGIDHLGLWPALEHYLETWARIAGIPVHVDLVARPGLDTPVALGAFRAVQEAMTNVAKHARATHVHVATRGAPDAVDISIVDDGIGMTRDDLRKPSAFGLLAMTERLRGLDGSVALEPAMPQGTRVTIRVPAQGDSG